MDGAELRKIRQDAGLTMRAAAALIDCRYRTLQDWERGVTTPDVARCRLFAHLLGLERIPFDVIRPQGKPTRADLDRLEGEIAEMLEHYSGAAGTQR